jgi:Tol biopolymer transport system component
LVKDAERRYQIAKDLRNELEELKQDVDSGEVFEGDPATAAKPKNRWLRHIPLVLAIAIAGIVGYQLRLGDVTEETKGPPIQGSFAQLTSAPGEEHFPSLAPDGAFFLYSSRFSGNWDIFLRRIGGEKPINLTEDCPEDDYQAVFSPDGGLIAFRSERGGGGIFLMGATGESVKRLTDFGYNPAWSPDGAQLAFATEPILDASNRTTTSELWSIHIESGEKHRIFQGDSVQPSWSPHGLRIAYWSVEDASGRRTGQRDLWTLSPEGGAPVQVTNDPHVDWNPVWSPDGRYLYYSSDRAGSTNLWRVRIDEKTGEPLGAPETVTTGAAASRRHLSFSREGREIAYVEQLLSRNLWKAPIHPASGRLDGNPIPITGGSRAAACPDVSPDGKWLAYYSFGAGKHEDLFVIATDGSGRRQLTDDQPSDRAPHWSPNGELLSFYSNRSGTYEIFTIRPDGSGLKQLTHTPGTSVSQNIWSPDGEKMAYFNRAERLSFIFDPHTPWEEQEPQALPPMSDPNEMFIVRSWSPNGNWLAGPVRNQSGNNVGIAVYSLESRQYKKLTKNGGGWPSWFADNRRLIFWDTEAEILYLGDLQSGQIEEILSIAPDEFICSALSRDNRWFYFGRQKNEADIWLLTLNEEQE